MDIEQIMELAKSPEGRELILGLVDQVRTEAVPIATLLRDTIGKDIDTLFDQYIEYAAGKTTRQFNTYMRYGFSRDESLALVIASQAEVKAAIRSAK